MFGTIINLLFDPKTAILIFLVFLIGYLVYMGEMGAFSQSFIHFGPGTDETNTTTFIGLKLDSWVKVGIMYMVSFLTALLTTYYNTVLYDNIHAYAFNRAITDVPYNKFWTYFAIMIDPFIMEILKVIQFFTSLTLQLQFILPQFVGAYLAETPFMVYLLGTKTFNGKK